MKRWDWPVAALVMALLAAACGSGKQPVVSAVSTTTATPAVTTTPEPLERRLERLLPVEKELPDLLVNQGVLDDTNEAAAGTDAPLLKRFRDTGRVTGVRTVYSYDAGARNISGGISYYNNIDEPKKLLRESGNPADHTATNRFQVAGGLGDEYIAQRLRLGGPESSAFVINIVFVRGPYFVSLADFGGTPTTPTDVTEKVARLIDDKLKATPKP